MTDITKEQAGRHLGKAVTYADQYDSNLLVPVERVHNRVGYGIDENDLPFIGYDTWNAYEVSFLLSNGFPVSCVAKINYPCTSHSIIESKSIIDWLKLLQFFVKILLRKSISKFI